MLADGTIDAAGVVRLDKPSTLAVTGGTGAYAGAHGTMSGIDTLTLG